MKKINSLVLLIMLSTAANSQVLLEENFNYNVGEPLTSNNWNITGTSTTNLINVADSNLSYSGYNSNSGKAAYLNTTGQDINRAFNNAVNSGNVYVSFLVRIATAQSAGDYFLHMGIATTNTSIFIGRVFCKLAANGNLAFGVSKSSTNTTTNPPAYGDSLFSVGTTYLLVMKYSFYFGTSDDTVKLFVNPALSGNEPIHYTSHATLTTGVDPDSLATLNLRQGSSSNAPTLVIDGIKVSQSWNDVVPVELTSFYAKLINGNVFLSWSTATETNNFGFEIEKSVGSTSASLSTSKQTAVSAWESIGFVNGAGTTNSEQTYLYTDKNISNGKYFYRLKQVDFDGSIAYSNQIEVVVGLPDEFALEQNFPNPFNPTTSIKYSIPVDGLVSLTIFNSIGEKIQTLVDEVQVAGNYSVNFDASALPSGVYFYRIKAGEFFAVRKMILAR